MSGKENLECGDESALDLLESLLEEGAEETNTISLAPEPTKSKDHSTKSLLSEKTSTNIHNGDTDSSDDEDNRYFESQKYNECGREMKKLINSNESSRSSLSSLFGYKQSEENSTWKSKLKTPLVVNSGCSPKSVEKVDVYSDPVFRIRIINPLITSKQLQERMIGRKAVTMASVKCHIANGGTESDWVIAGVVVQKSPIRTSQKGSQYCIWKISDLKGNLKTVSVFFFRNSHKDLWKTSLGTVVGILNPKVMDDSKDGDEATLAVDTAQKVMIFGISKDYGICQARKKNGDPCTAFVNKNTCTYCIYHVQQEYKKCSRRSDLQGLSLGRSALGHNALRNKVLGKNEVFYAGQSFSAIPATVNRKQSAKDDAKLRQLKLGKTVTPNSKNQNNSKDKQTLSMLGLSQTMSSSPANISKCAPASLNSVPQMSKSAQIDLSTPINKVMVNRAKINALEWVKRNGKFGKHDPNEIRKKEAPKRKSESTSPEDRATKVLKMASKTYVPKPEIESASKPVLPSQFMELLATKSKHLDLIEASDAHAQEEYFNLLEKKEKIEEKMLTTYKVPCKAVHCLKCKYTSFSASEMCKKERHPLKVTDSVKRFFKCKNCGNRTATLELIPLLSCKLCGGGQWERAPMLKERKGNNLQINPLSIRGGEETFLGSVVADGNVNLLVPE